MWESLYINSLKVLKKHELYKDIGDNMSNTELRIDYCWQVKDFRALKDYL